MDVSIEKGPGSAAARVRMRKGETFTAEAGAMIAMSDSVTIATTTHKKKSGGILKAAKRMLSGESFFLNHFTAHEEGSEVILAATLPGDMATYDLENENYIVQAGSYVASEEALEVDMGWQGFKSLLSGEHMFWLHIKGTGRLLLNSYGAIYPIQVSDEVIVDTGHIVAFTEGLDFDITKAGKSWISSILGGEGLVCKFHGKGTVLCQSHNDSSFGKILGPMLKPRR